MYASRDVCDAARAQLSPEEQQELHREARRRGCGLNEALLAVSLENLQQQLYALSRSSARGRLELVKG